MNRAPFKQVNIEAAEVDRILQREREEARIAEKRDDVRSRLAAMVYGVEPAATNRDSETADAVREASGVFEVEAVESGAQQRPKKLAKKPIQGNAITARVIVHRIKQFLPR